MPACSEENFAGGWPSSSPPISRSNSVSPPLPSSPSSPFSPFSTSPSLTSPISSSLKRSTSNVSNCSNCSNGSHVSNNSSTQTVIFAPRRRRHRSNLQTIEALSRFPQERTIRENFLVWLSSCYLSFLLSVFKGIFHAISYIFWAPATWASAWVCLFWVILQLPLTMLKWTITILHTPASERARTKRCVLISGGSTVQAVHLARNFHKAGARVVVCEQEGLFSLARFSTACAKFYTVPRPSSANAAEYVKALKDIAQKEKAVYYIPVSATNAAYYDALAKPHLEIMGCECFVPSAAEVTALDDPLELLRRCRNLGLSTPEHFVLRSMDDAARLYEGNTLRSGRYVMMAAGPAGMRDRAKVVLPLTAREFRNQRYDVSERNPWVVVRDPGGEHFVTCTTVKSSKVVANVTCRVDETRGLIPEDRGDVVDWLNRFFERSFSSRVNGHLSFRLARSEGNDQELVSIGCRVGLAFPYVCLTGIHPRLVWKPCRHFSRGNSGIFDGHQEKVVQTDGAGAAASNGKRFPGEPATRLLGNVLDKREALFAYWDPLPYCAYYHLQLPFRRLAGVIRAPPSRHNPPLGVVQ